jgi:phenylacetate-CoA oxygenase PaaI subunit
MTPDVRSLTRTAPESPLAIEVVVALLSLADDELIIGHRHSEWLGLSPFLEEDLTLSSIAQDEFGHARGLYALIWPDWTDREAGVTRRPANHWRSCELVELPGQPWEHSLVRHFLYDLAEPFRWTGLVDQYGSTVPGLSDLAQTALAEERFHGRHATDLLVRLGNDVVGAERLQPQLDALCPIVGPLTSGMTADGHAEFVLSFTKAINATQLRLPATTWSTAPSDRTSRSASFIEIQAALLDVVSYDPEATW